MKLRISTLVIIALFPFIDCGAKNVFYREIIQMNYGQVEIYNSLVLPKRLLDCVSEEWDKFEAIRPIGLYIDTLSGSISYTKYHKFEPFDTTDTIVDCRQYFLEHVESATIKNPNITEKKSKEIHCSCNYEENDSIIFLNKEKTIKMQVYFCIDHMYTVTLKAFFYEFRHREWVLYDEFVVDENVIHFLAIICVKVFEISGTNYFIPYISAIYDEVILNSSERGYLLLPSQEFKKVKL